MTNLGQWLLDHMQGALVALAVVGLLARGLAHAHRQHLEEKRRKLEAALGGQRVRRPPEEPATPNRR